MPRPSSIKTLPPEQRAFIEKLLRKDQHTLDEMLALIRKEFPAHDSPSRSSLGRYRQSFEEMSGRMRMIQEASQMLVSEFGEDVDDKAGALLTQAVTTLVTTCALESNAADAELTTKEAGELARAARAVMEARTMSLKERENIRRIARDELIREQREKLDALSKSGEIDQSVLSKVIKAAYGLEA